MTAATGGQDRRRAAAARKERRARRRLPENPYLQITSMTDMFTLILAFLLTFYDPNVVDAPSLVLPAVPASAGEKDGSRLEVRTDAIVLGGVRVLTLDGHGRYLGGRTADASGLPELRDALAALPHPEAPLLLACDKAVPYSIVGDVLTSAHAAGVDDYRFVVESTR